MTDLKTLKELGTKFVGGVDGTVYTEKELKREAVKWIKLIKSGFDVEDDTEGILSINWIKHFFDIKDEDLR